jgi:hypothetical protein
MLMKKLLLLGLIALTPFALTGCGTADEPQTPEEEIVTGGEEIVNEIEIGGEELINEIEAGLETGYEDVVNAIEGDTTETPVEETPEAVG